MKTFKRLKQYKAKEPYETVSQIRNILAEHDIFLSETSRVNEAADVASCRIWLSDEDLAMGDFGTNGKGMNARYALASAYGEFMERLQNMTIFGDYAENAFRKGLTRFMAAPDEVMLTAREAWEESGDILTKLLRLDDDACAALLSELSSDMLSSGILSSDTPPSDMLSSGSPANYQDSGPSDFSVKMPCLPYRDLFSGRTVLLPHKTLRMVTGSNGMAAGNTYMEALVQGLSEIYERAAVMEAYRDNPRIPQLDPALFAGNAIYDRLERMKFYGFNYKILDLSMGKGYPVVGLLLERGTGVMKEVAFKAGADPCPVTALERCLTEAFQGNAEETSRLFHRDCCEDFTKLTDNRRRMAVNEAEIAYHVDGSGKTADCLFHPSDAFSSDFAGTEGVSEKDDYDYMVSLTRGLGYGLCIRDCSFLGFPAYHIIVPELSNYDLIFDGGADIFRWSFEPTEFRNDRCTEGCARIMNNISRRSVNSV